MPQQIADQYTMYQPQNLKSSLFQNFQTAGIDTFPSGPNQSDIAFLDLTNVMPAVSGGFRLRWAFANAGSGLSGAFVPIRAITYNGYKDALNPTITSAVNAVYLTDNQHFYPLSIAAPAAGLTYTPLFDVVPTTGGPASFASSGSVFGVQSRNWLYVSNGSSQPRKVCPAYTTKSTESAWGIVPPNSSITLNGTTTYTIRATGGTGKNYSATPTVTISGGGGTGATATANVFDGMITSFTVTNQGSKFTSQPAVTITDSTGSGAAAVAAYGTDGTLTAILPSGHITLNGGRQYTYVYQSSLTGHSSDLPAGIDVGTGGYVPSPIEGVQGIVPSYVGFSQILVTITPSGPIDSQVDTLVLLATSDGGSLEELYEVTTIPFNTAGGSGVLTYLDLAPDTYTYSGNLVVGIDMATDLDYVGDTLLNQDLWVNTDASGVTYGVAGNQPPPHTILYPTLHQGRMFATDGKSVFFSKSLSEVTTSTGLITSKWEESWPAENQLAISLENETVTSLISDGTVLHIGTTDKIYSLEGSDPTTFNIPNMLFQETGVVSQDLITAIYADGEPAGFMWMTPDLKLMYSDFSTYTDVGVPIYTLLSRLNLINLDTTSLRSLTYGPYNLVILTYQIYEGFTEFLVFETRLRKWFRWNAFMTQYTASGYGTLYKQMQSSFVYQDPSSGVRSFFSVLCDLSGDPPSVFYLSPSQVLDNGTDAINWNIQTSWFSQDDPTAFKIVNEIEAYAPSTTTQVTLYGASVPSDFANPKTLKTGPLVIGPLKTSKLYCAGVPTVARYHSVQFSGHSVGSDVQPSDVLTRFTVDSFPVARI